MFALVVRTQMVAHIQIIAVGSILQLTALIPVSHNVVQMKCGVLAATMRKDVNCQTSACRMIRQAVAQHTAPALRLVVQTKPCAKVVQTHGTLMVVQLLIIAVDLILPADANIHVKSTVVRTNSGAGAGTMQTDVNSQPRACEMIRRALALHPAPRLVVRTKMFALVVQTLGTQMVAHIQIIAVGSIVTPIARGHVTPIVVQMKHGVGADTMRTAVNYPIHV
jgi:hypothetical protein